MGEEFGPECPQRFHYPIPPTLQYGRFDESVWSLLQCVLPARSCTIQSSTSGGLGGAEIFSSRMSLVSCGFGLDDSARVIATSYGRFVSAIWAVAVKPQLSLNHLE